LRTRPDSNNHNYRETSEACGDSAFRDCDLGSVTLPATVTNIGSAAFFNNPGLGQAFFRGNAPLNDGSSASNNYDIFGDGYCPCAADVYYAPGTTGWGTNFGSFPTALWYPNPQITGGLPKTNFANGGFQFTISWTSEGSTVVIDSSTNLPHWTPFATNTIQNGTTTLYDPLWTNFHQRFYRIEPQ
jgi:hypothetical protein